MFLITGITGNVGGATARHLLAAGQTVRALVRDPQKAALWAAQGVELHRGDFTDTAAVASALEGVEGAYLMMPPFQTLSPGYPEPKAVAASFAQALTQAPPPRLVLLSSFGSEKESGLGNITSTHILEQALDDFPFPTALIRAGGFIENAVGSLDTAAKTGVYYSFFQPTDRAVPAIATEDIGAEVARLLSEGWQGKKIVEIGTPTSPDALAQAMSEVVGRPVTAQAIPRERWTATLEGFGMPPGTTGTYEEMMDGCNSGWISFGAPGAESVAGTTTPAQVFAAARGGGDKS